MGAGFSHIRLFVFGGTLSDLIIFVMSEHFVDGDGIIARQFFVIKIEPKKIGQLLYILSSLLNSNVPSEQWTVTGFE